MRLRLRVLVLIATATLAGNLTAQTLPDSLPTVTTATTAGAFQTKAGIVGVRIDNMDAAPVKGTPFCATITTEHTQPFADGNRIHTTDSSMLCRDSEGRTRREASLNLLGAAPQTSVPKIITITDPVADVRYLLDPERKIAHRTPLASSVSAAAGGSSISGQVGVSAKGPVMVYGSGGGPGTNLFFNRVLIKNAGQDPDGSAPETENLGDQTIDGIHATGTRLTTTIPAGKMGNERPIVVTSERWYSSELQATVMTKHNDPWAGELKTEFTNVNTAEPDPSLFNVPADYKIVDGPAGPPLAIPLPPPDPPAQ